MEPQVRRWLAFAARQLEIGHPAGAIDALRRALTEDPDLPEAHAMLAMALLGDKRIHAALHEAQQALALAPEAAISHLAMGRCLILHRKLARAEEHLRRAVELEPWNVRGQLALASLHAVRHDRTQERAALDEALALAPDEPDVLAALADHHLRRGSLDDAGRLSLEALAIEPEHVDSLVVQGHVLLRRGDVEEARQHAIWALSGNATDPAALGLLSAIKARQSWVLGLWWRYNTALVSRGMGFAIVILLGAFIVYRVGTIALEDAAMGELSGALRFLWLGICAYTWVAPGIFAKQLRKELGRVELDESY